MKIKLNSGKVEQKKYKYSELEEGLYIPLDLDDTYRIYVNDVKQKFYIDLTEGVFEIADDVKWASNLFIEDTSTSSITLTFQ